MPARERLLFEPLQNTWRWERISEDDRILDYFELTASGIASRFDLDHVKSSLVSALAALEAV